MEFPGMSDAPGYDDPVEMLQACHGRIQAQCGTLLKLHAHLPLHGCDTQARQAASAILRYFDTAGRFHHQDEEQDFFPMLISSGDPRAKQLVAALLAQHIGLDDAWAGLRVALAGIAAGYPTSLADGQVQDFVTAYRSHIETENSELLPLARRLLTEAQRERLGRAMSARRGVIYPAG